MHARWPVWSMLGVLLGAGGCRRVDKVVVSPRSLVLREQGQSDSLKVTVLDQKGRPMPQEKVTFLSSDANIAVVDREGTVSAAAPGHVQIVARSQTRPEREDSADVDVKMPAKLKVRAGDLELVSEFQRGGNARPGPKLKHLGDKLRFEAHVLDYADREIFGEPWKLTVNDTTILTPDPDGKGVTAKAFGRTTVAVTAGPLLGLSMTVTVTPPDTTEISLRPKMLILKVGQIGEITPTLTNTHGPIDSESILSWYSTNPSVAAVGRRYVDAKAPGEADIVVATEDKEARVHVFVR